MFPFKKKDDKNIPEKLKNQVSAIKGSMKEGSKAEEKGESKKKEKSEK